MIYMIDEKNFRKIKWLADKGLWIGGFVYYDQWDGQELQSAFIYLT